MSKNPSIYDEISVVDLPPEPSDSLLHAKIKEGSDSMPVEPLEPSDRLEREDKSDFVEAIRMEEFDTALPSEPSDSPDELSDFLFSTTNVGDDLIGEAVFDQAKLERLADLIAERERLAKIEVLSKVNKPGVESYLIADELRNLEGTKDQARFICQNCSERNWHSDERCENEVVTSHVDAHETNPGGCVFPHPHKKLTVVSQPTSDSVTEVPKSTPKPSSDTQVGLGFQGLGFPDD